MGKVFYVDLIDFGVYGKVGAIISINFKACYLADSPVVDDRRLRIL